MSYFIYKVDLTVNKKPEYLPSFHTQEIHIILKDVDISLGVGQASNKALLETRKLYNEAYDVTVIKVEFIGSTEEIYNE